MHSSILFPLVLLAAAAPSMAAPVSTGAYASPAVNLQTSAPNGLTTDASGAFSLTSLLGPIIHVVSGLFGGSNDQNQRREFEELLTRELMARTTDIDESGAFGLASLIGPAISLFSGLFSGNDKREFEELFSRSMNAEFARELMAGDESAAFNLGSLFGPIVKAIGTIFGGNNQNQRREFEELLTRELVARATDLDESEAFGLASLIGPAISLFSGLFSGNNKREFEELFTRALQEELVARANGDLDESDAFSLTSLLGPVIKAIGGLFGNDQNQNQGREFVARSLYDLD